MQVQENLRDTIITAISEACYLPREQVRPDLPLTEMGLDSLAIASIASSVENATRSEFSPDDLVALFEAENVGALIDRIVSLTDTPRA